MAQYPRGARSSACNVNLAASASPSGVREVFCQDSPCALTLYASNGARARAKFVHVKINACLELAPVSNKC